MIYVSRDQLKQVEYLIDQSKKGNHVLFDPDTVRRVFKRSSPGRTKEQEIEEHIEKLILQPTITQKRAYLERLTPEIHDQVVRTYFNIVENNLFESQEVRH